MLQDPPTMQLATRTANHILCPHFPSYTQLIEKESRDIVCGWDWRRKVGTQYAVGYAHSQPHTATPLSFFNLWIRQLHTHYIVSLLKFWSPTLAAMYELYMGIVLCGSFFEVLQGVIATPSMSKHVDGFGRITFHMQVCSAYILLLLLYALCAHLYVVSYPDPPFNRPRGGSVLRLTCIMH